MVYGPPMVLRTRPAGPTMNRHGSNRCSGRTRGLWTTNGTQDPLGGLARRGRSNRKTPSVNLFTPKSVKDIGITEAIHFNPILRIH